MKQSVADKIQALIERGATEGEREAARHALKRFTDHRDAEALKKSALYYQMTQGWTGDKRPSGYVPLEDIVTMIRTEIKTLKSLSSLVNSKSGGLAIPNAIVDIPKGIRITVSKTYDGHGSIYITVGNLPEEWAWKKITNHPNYREGTVVFEPTEALLKLGRALRDIHDSYNYDKSDSMVDYFDRGYYGEVYAVTPDKWKKDIGR